MSYSFFSVVDAPCSPRACSRSVTLSALQARGRSVDQRVPLNVLPPAFGMAFMITPLVPVSAIWPESCTST